MAKAEDNAQELAQRLIDFSAIQNTKNFEYFENTEAGYYRLRALNASDPQNSGDGVQRKFVSALNSLLGPAAMAKLLNGKTPAYSGSLLIRGTSTFVSYFGILSTGYPSTICRLQKRDHLQNSGHRCGYSVGKS
uniref:Uncharacterized protein n=1 Tax=Spongospora subterranea TaxID=70186 RepID=A0A0H5R5Z2_9EUKA|eukprot:CRZ03639.1 hypothetical protein [Spongospora subterranea]